MGPALSVTGPSPTSGAQTSLLPVPEIGKLGNLYLQPFPNFPDRAGPSGLGSFQTLLKMWGVHWAEATTHEKEPPSCGSLDDVPSL